MLNPARPVAHNSAYDLWGSLPFAAVHVACFAIFFMPLHWFCVALCLGLYVVRMFAITGAYHRYFSHRTYKTSRPVQFLMALAGTLAVQKGPLWWAANHRHHHRHSDTVEDIHSPGLQGLWWSHAGWITSNIWKDTDLDEIRDFAEYPELRFINRHHLIAPLLLAFLCFSTGAWLEYMRIPGLEVTGGQTLIWGFFVSTTLLYHGTFCINSFCHLLGRKRYKTGDESRNSLTLALITLGEGWHNNHHYYPGSERQGFFWYEIDITHYGLKVLSWLGLVWDLRGPPPHVLQMARAKSSEPRPQ